MYPETMHNNPDIGTLEILWSDGTQQRLNNAFMRHQRLCADCKAMRLHGKAALAENSKVRICAIRPVGAYGVQFIFNDGHERGIFPWSYLKSLGLNKEAAIET